MILGAIFDFDNTLYDYDSANIKGLESIFNLIYLKYDIMIDKIKYEYNIINNSIKNSNNYNNKFNKSIYFKNLLEVLNIKLSVLDEIIELYNNEFNNNLKLYDNILLILQLFKNKKIKIGILSNNIFKQQYDKLVKLNIIDLIDYIVTSDMIGCEKPDMNIYYNIINKMNIPCENLIMIGDNYDHDILPCLKLNIIPYHYNDNMNSHNIKIINNYFEFGNYDSLYNYFIEYFKTIDSLIFLSKYFGQSVLNIQGQGGNISVKLNDMLFIKASGYILGNTEYNSGYCIVNNSINTRELKYFGTKKPSMETFFHSYMKKYTVHLHFTLSNMFLCCDMEEVCRELNINYVIIDYYNPGIILSNKIKEQYNDTIDLVLLKNHGIIITSNYIPDIFEIYLNIFNHFNKMLDYKYTYELNTFVINKFIYDKFNKMIVCKYFDEIKVQFLLEIKYCFPDMVIYIQNIIVLNNIDELITLEIVPDIIIIDEYIYVIADNITKYYCIIEIINKYKLLCENYNKLKLIEVLKLRNMEEEKYRKTI